MQGGGGGAGGVHREGAVGGAEAWVLECNLRQHRYDRGALPCSPPPRPPSHTHHTPHFLRPAAHLPTLFNAAPPPPPLAAVAYGVIAGMVSYTSIHLPFWLLDKLRKRFGGDVASPRAKRALRRCARAAAGARGAYEGAAASNRCCSVEPPPHTPALVALLACVLASACQTGLFWSPLSPVTHHMPQPRF